MTETVKSDAAGVVVAATFTIEPLLPALELLLEQAGVTLQARAAPYHQVFQELLDPSRQLAGNAAGVNVLVVRSEDFVRDVGTAEFSPASLDRTIDDLWEALSQFAVRSPSPVLLVLPPTSPHIAPALSPAVKAAGVRFAEAASRAPKIQVIGPEDIAPHCSGEIFDALRDDLAHIPYTEEYYAAIALAVVRQIHALRVPPQKVLVLDCDNTLWRGVVGEDGVQGIGLDECYQRVQAFAMRAQKAGALLCLTSKNAERDVLDVFGRRSDMLLKLDSIIAHRINWQSKPQNIASLARELNLGLDSFVFLDDNPVECAQMQAQLPQVLTLQLPPESDIATFLDNLWVFDKISVTQEDARRTQLYRENIARQAFENTTSDIGEFMASLGLVVDILEPEEADWARVSQLTQRTNQFNFTTVRRSEAQMRAAQKGGAHVLRVRVRDRFGDYGLVGVMVAQPEGTGLLVDTLLLSCRVLGRGVEHAMLRSLGEMAHRLGLEHVELPFLPTMRNEPAQAFADSVAAAHRTDEQGRALYRIPTAAACQIAHQPGRDPDAVIRARKAEEAKSTATAASSSTISTNRAERYYRLATKLTGGRAILEAVRAQARHKRTLQNAPTPPSTAAERQLQLLWQELLNIDTVGVEDDYFALGGTSLLAARMFAEIERRFGVRERLTTILDAPTVRSLAPYLERRASSRSEALLELRRGGPLNLFLVHDGDGETLLYRTLAGLMDDAVTVYGIEPPREPSIPLADASISALAARYVQLIRQRQARGPYLIGGLCAGGVIAYEMACQLRRAGEEVSLVALLDAARPRAPKRRGRIARQRAQRFEQMLANMRQDAVSPWSRATRLLAGAAQKFAGLSQWLMRSRLRRLSVRFRFALLARTLARRRPWPAHLPPLTFREIYDSAESRYRPPKLTGAGVTLFLADSTLGDETDTPYRLVYADESLGWREHVPDLRIVSVAGGHSSMLQEPSVQGLAATLSSLTGHIPIPSAAISAR